MQKFFKDSNGHKIAYNFLEGNNKSYIFLGGLKSDKEGRKALFFEEYCKKNNYSYLRFDYLGHGNSDLDFTDCNIDTWLENAYEIINHLFQEKVNLIGSSLGGWLIFLLAKKMPEKIESLTGIASAPDFTEKLMWEKFSKEAQANLKQGKIHNIPCDYDESDGYPIKYHLIESGRKNLLLTKPQNINLPITLFHGMQDQDVPYQFSLELAKNLSSQNIKIHLLKSADHRMSEPEELKFIINYL